MSDDTHAPGPWHIGRDSEGGAFVGGDGTVIADMVGPKARRKANAHLIAAAPELLAALKKMLPEANSADLHLRPSFEVCEAARDAIAKAEGRS